MRKFVLFVTVLVLAIVALRRFGPTLRARAEAKCQEMMARCEGEAGERQVAGLGWRTELAGTHERG